MRATELPTVPKPTSATLQTRPLDVFFADDFARDCDVIFADDCFFFMTGLGGQREEAAFFFAGLAFAAPLAFPKK
jgi:hypothetical protein